MKKREKKQKIIEELKLLFSKYESIFFISLKNLKVNNLLKIKKELNNLNSKLKVAKKNLIKIANKDLENILENQIFKTPIGLIFSNKETDFEIINLISNFNKELKLEFIGSYLANNFYESSRVLSLSKFNNKNELYYSLINLLKSNLVKLIFDLKYPLLKLNLVVNNI